MNSIPPRKPLDVVRKTIRLKHYSYRIERTYSKSVWEPYTHVLARGGRGIRSPLDD